MFNTGKVTRLAACLLLIAFGIQPVQAQSKPPLEYQVKAAFLFNFTRFIHWPASAYAADDAPFVIGIMGNDPFGSYLDDLVEGEQVDGHRITVRRCQDNKDISGCQLLFINTNDPARLKEALLLTGHQSILTVSDASNFIKAGGMVRFLNEDNRIKMVIKLALAKAAQLDISAKLLKVAQVN